MMWACDTGTRSAASKNSATAIWCDIAQRVRSPKAPASIALSSSVSRMASHDLQSSFESKVTPCCACSKSAAKPLVRVAIARDRYRTADRANLQKSIVRSLPWSKPCAAQHPPRVRVLNIKLAILGVCRPGPSKASLHRSAVKDLRAARLCPQRDRGGSRACCMPRRCRVTPARACAPALLIHGVTTGGALHIRSYPAFEGRITYSTPVSRHPKPSLVLAFNRNGSTA
jgi:hypothetical protein